MTVITKIITGVGSVIVVGGGVGLGVHLMNYSTINNRLTSEGFELTISEQEWKEIAKAHNLAKKNFFEGTNKDNVDWLKQMCRDSLSKKEKDEKNYNLARQWCVKPETISDLLTKKTKVLITVEATNTDDNSWKSKINSLNSSDKTNLNLTIGTDDTANVKDIKAKCKAILNKKTTDPEFYEKFETVKRVCTVPKK